MGAASKAFLIFIGASTGSFLFLICASLWAGSPIQDLVVSAHGRIVDHPDHKLTPEQVKDLMVLIEHHAVLPADVIIEKVVEFYTTLINLLIGLLAILGIIAYMYIRTTSSEQVSAQTDSFLNSDNFKNLVITAVGRDFNSAIEIASGDYAEMLDSWGVVVEKISALEKGLKRIEHTLSERDAEESGGESLNITSRGE